MLRSQGQAGVAFRTVTANANVLPTDGTISVDATAGNVTITFPLSTTLNGRIVSVCKVDATANTVTIAKNSADTFSNAAPSLSISVQGDSFSLEANGAKNMLVLI